MFGEVVLEVESACVVRPVFVSVGPPILDAFSHSLRGEPFHAGMVAAVPQAQLATGLEVPSQPIWLVGISHLRRRKRIVRRYLNNNCRNRVETSRSRRNLPFKIYSVRSAIGWTCFDETEFK